MPTVFTEPVSGLGAAALDLLPQSLYIVDRNLVVVAWNARREQGPLGLARVRALGHHLRDVLSPRGFDSVLPILQRVLDTGRTFEERRTTCDGRRTYRVRRMPIRTGDTVTHVATLSDEVGADAPEPREHRHEVALRGVIPVCGWCKKIRDSLGDWYQLEAYLATRSEASFTHGICADCSGRAFLEWQNPGPAAVTARPDYPRDP